MIQASNVPVSLDALLPKNESLFRREIARALGVKGSALVEVKLLKRSIDARKKSNVHGVVTVAVEVGGRRCAAVGEGRGGQGLRTCCASFDTARGADRAASVVVGAGPAGLFCALYLARAGLQPLVVERGTSVDERVAVVEAFNAGAPLDERTNIQFGEGGAGTFSDGKLNTGIKSPISAMCWRPSWRPARRRTSSWTPSLISAPTCSSTSCATCVGHRGGRGRGAVPYAP